MSRYQCSSKRYSCFKEHKGSCNNSFTLNQRNLKNDILKATCFALNEDSGSATVSMSAEFDLLRRHCTPMGEDGILPDNFSVYDDEPDLDYPTDGFSSIPEAIEDIRQGKARFASLLLFLKILSDIALFAQFVIVVDDENRQNEGDLTMAASLVTPEAMAFLVKYGTGIVCVSMKEEDLERLDLPLMAYCYHSVVDGTEHIAMVKIALSPCTQGDIGDGLDILVRMHSECLTGDLFGSATCDCSCQLEMAMKMIEKAGRGVLVYLRGREGRDSGLGHKLRAYDLQEYGVIAQVEDTNCNYREQKLLGGEKRLIEHVYRSEFNGHVIASEQATELTKTMWPRSTELLAMPIYIDRDLPTGVCFPSTFLL
ncbi:hypothetical protein ZIOFF_037110 [Zingiber officinale]|uniref:3,4-dihydroxy-2-butanone-4-phosphate synthase n=1 Tax=Zingiber officinale TaxID=94328 RepID=A0A8J5GP58_ZINOF|nr:hypothetical protein ZIOFF_037110 [Zingiber officinale]